MFLLDQNEFHRDRTNFINKDDTNHYIQSKYVDFHR